MERLTDAPEDEVVLAVPGFGELERLVEKELVRHLSSGEKSSSP
jgi:hypothetical protein